MIVLHPVVGLTFIEADDIPSCTHTHTHTYTHTHISFYSSLSLSGTSEADICSMDHK